MRRCIAAKEVSDNAFLSCTPTSALLTGRVSPTSLPVKTNRMRSYRAALIISTSTFILSWLSFHTASLFFTFSTTLWQLSILPVTSTLFLNPFFDIWQHKELQGQLRRLFNSLSTISRRRNHRKSVQRITSIPAVEIADFAEPVSEEELVLHTGSWLLIIKLDCSREETHERDIFTCPAVECVGTGV